MSDDVDRAQQRDEEFREDALQAQQRRAGLTGAGGAGRYAVSARTCGVCGELIPINRRRAVPGVQTCIDCQQELERGLRGDGRHHG